MSKNFSKYVNNPHTNLIFKTKPIYFLTLLTGFLTNKYKILDYYNKQKIYFKQINIFYYYCYFFI